MLKLIMKKIIMVVIVVVIGVVMIPKMNWGRVTMQPGEVVTVTGEARKIEKNQMASFTAGVESVNDKKEEAVKEVNDKVQALISAVKGFGIKTEDIKTQNTSVYQSEEMYWDNGVQKSRKGQWRVSNSIEIVLREVDKTSALTDLLNASGANNVYGPNFQMDSSNKVETELFDEAIKNAREKAEAIAKASGRNLGKVMSVNEGGSVSNLPIYAAKDGMGGGSPIEPGSSTISKSVIVVFELK
jgi:uncharacterized protein YggE